MKKQWQLFLLALAFFTRIPIPGSVPFSEGRLNRANRYFGCVGLVVGGLSALVYWLAEPLFSQSVAVLFAMSSSLLVTGVFHEDGLADTADGLGGGLERDAKLAIMKDSRIGSYGSAALIMCLLLKFASLSSLSSVAVALIVGHGLSRVIAASLIGSLPYVQEEQRSKSKPLANQQSSSDRKVLLITALAIVLFLPFTLTLSLLGLAVILRWGFIRWLNRQLGGYTGDTLGACQQISEVAIYLCLALPWFHSAGGIG